MSFEDPLLAVEDGNNTSQSNNGGTLPLSGDQYMLHPDVFAYDLFGVSFENSAAAGISRNDSSNNNSGSNSNNSNGDSDSGNNAATGPSIGVLDSSMSMMVTSFNSNSSASSNSPPNDTQFAEIFTAKPKPKLQQSRPSGNTATRFKEPIFVTESPQDAYKKKKRKGASTSQSPSEEDDDFDNLTESDRAKLKQMTSKERRQLRNKISARNFRVRRKGKEKIGDTDPMPFFILLQANPRINQPTEYIEQLENKVREQENEIKDLRETTTRLQKINQELQQELQQWRGLPSLPVNENTPPSSGASDVNGQSPEAGLMNTFNGGIQVAELDSIMPLFDFSFETNVSTAVMPDFDYERVFTEKALVKQRDLSSQELMRTYPLLVPALMSIIVGQTLTMHPLPHFPMSDEPAWDKLAPTFLWPSNDYFEPVVAAGAGGDQDDNGQLDRVSSHSLALGASSPSSDSTNTVVGTHSDEVIRKHYIYYAFMRLAGFSDKQIIARKMQKKVTPKKRPLATVAAFCSVGTTLLRHPERKTMLCTVMKNDHFANPSWSQSSSSSSRHLRPFSAIKNNSPVTQNLPYHNTVRV